MLGFAWLTLRQAQEALKNGRLEEAQHLLGHGAAQGHKRSWEMLQQLAQAFIARGERHLREQDPEAAWNDLLHAEQVGVQEGGVARLRQDLIRQSIGEARALLDAGEPSRAGEILVQLRGRSVRNSELEVLEEASRHWTVARDQANRGDFSQALQTIARVHRLMPGPHAALDQFQRDLEHKGPTFSGLLGKLHEAVNQARWPEVIDLAEQVLAAAPQHVEARKARGRAWKAIEPVTVADKPAVVEAAGPVGPEPGQRFMLWIDGIGGYLICLANKVTIGQATPDVYVDVPLFADISRSHLSLTREVEGYVLEAHRPVQINGKPADKALLHANDRITLGNACQLQFRQPVPVSATARLDIVSGHRLPIAVDGILLMADTLVLGPGEHVHVSMPDLKDTIVLFRNKDGLGVRYGGKMSVDGHSCRDRGTLGPSSTVMGDNFAFSVEPVGPRLGRL